MSMNFAATTFSHKFTLTNFKIAYLRYILSGWRYLCIPYSSRSSTETKHWCSCFCSWYSQGFLLACHCWSIWVLSGSLSHILIWFLHDHLIFYFSNVFSGNWFYLQVSIPLGMYDNLPVSVSLVAKHGSDGFLLNLVETLHDTLKEEIQAAERTSFQ